MKHLFLTIVFVVVCTATLTAQTFNLSAELRPRYENKHGYKVLQATDADGANFISQRTRINFGFKNEKLKTYVSLQNTRVWGDVGTLAAQDNAGAGIGTTVHQAWADVSLAKNLSVKLGRQEIIYDDSRIFGNVGWAQQARSHDAFVFKFNPNKDNRLDFGVALNADSQSGVDNPYTTQHKAFQYLWYHGNFSNIGLSILALNTGLEYIDADSKQKIAYRQTVGPRITYKKDKINANAAVYYQSGKVSETTKVNALYYTLNFGYKVSDNFKVALGYEYLSGKDQDDTDTDMKTFAPLFGTNHKFNGWMDYFYVGYGNTTGLQDINATFAYKKDKFSAKLIPHLFAATNQVFNGADKMNNSLGTEIDFTLGYKIAKDITFSAGYSQMLATDTLEVLKGGDKSEHNSWAWMMFTVKPSLFTHTVKK